MFLSRLYVNLSTNRLQNFHRIIYYTRTNKNNLNLIFLEKTYKQNVLGTFILKRITFSVEDVTEVNKTISQFCTKIDVSDRDGYTTEGGARAQVSSHTVSRNVSNEKIKYK